MQRIKMYKVLFGAGDNIVAFQDEVNRWINLGWQPLGGVFLSSPPDPLTCYQTMVLYDDDSTEEEDDEAPRKKDAGHLYDAGRRRR